MSRRAVLQGGARVAMAPVDTWLAASRGGVRNVAGPRKITGRLGTLLRDLAVRHLAIDFDLTLHDRHTCGNPLPSEELEKLRIRPELRELVHEAPPYSIVTFCHPVPNALPLLSGSALVRRTIELHKLPPAKAIYAYNPAAAQIPQELKDAHTELKPFDVVPCNKLLHLWLLLRNEALTAPQVLLIDDSLENVLSAAAVGFPAVHLKLSRNHEVDFHLYTAESDA